MKPTEVIQATVVEIDGVYRHTEGRGDVHQCSPGQLAQPDDPMSGHDTPREAHHDAHGRGQNHKERRRCDGVNQRAEALDIRPCEACSGHAAWAERLISWNAVAEREGFTETASLVAPDPNLEDNDIGVFQCALPMRLANRCGADFDTSVCCEHP